MARKRRALFHNLHPLLKQGLRKSFYRRRRFLIRDAILPFLIALLLTTNLSIVWAQSPGTESLTQTPADPTELVNQAQANYASGNYQLAVKHLQEALGSFNSSEEQLKRAIALSNLSLSFQALRDWDNAQNAIEESLAILGIDSVTLESRDTPDEQHLKILAPTLDIYGHFWLNLGNPHQAITVWQQASAIYSQLNQQSGWLDSQINELQALQALGLYQQAAKLAENLDDKLQGLPDSLTKSRGLRSYGEALRNIGDLNASQEKLSESLAITQAIDLSQWESTQELSAVYLSLGNTNKALADRDKERQIYSNRQGMLPWQCIPLKKALPKEALLFYQDAEDNYFKAETLLEESYNENTARLSSESMTYLSARLNRLSVLLEQNQVNTSTQQLWHRIYQQLDVLPPSRSTVYAEIDLAKRGGCLKQLTNQEDITWEEIIAISKNAVEHAKILRDPRAESYALGNLGGLYEFFDRLDSTNIKGLKDKASNSYQIAAQMLTEEALVVAQPSAYPDIAYQWQWQLGRIKQAEGMSEEAIDYYEKSVATLEAVRGNLLTIASDLQFSFRDNVEPVYRELVDLLLSKGPEPSQEELRTVIDLIDNLQLAELENFLRCSLPEAILTEQAVDPNAAIFYPIILRDRLEVILSLPKEESDEPTLIRKVSTTLSEQPPSQGFETEFEEVIQELQNELRRANKIKAVKSLSSILYKALIAPFETELDIDAQLADSNVRTLVFASDGILRNLPMPVLFDSQRDRYLLERYAIAIAPSVKLLQPEPLPRNVRVLVAGSDQAQDHPFQPYPFPALSFVKPEIEAIQGLFPSEELFNEEFNKKALQSELDSSKYSIVHIATHGVFSSDPQKTFIITAEEPLFAKDIDLLLRSQGGTNGEVKLLVLSACQTATGDNRAVLGLAGLTVRAGSSSTLATLWSVDDESAAQLIEQFYLELKTHPDITRAEALRRSQVKLLQNGNWNAPRHWAPYVLVGNWL